MSLPPKDDLSINTAQVALSAAQCDRLEEIASNIQSRFGRLFYDIYETGKELLEVKALFGWGQNSEFLGWAREKTGLSTSLCYSMMSVGRAFLPFENQDSLTALNQVETKVLYRISADITPRAARTEFVDRVLKGETFDLERVEALIQRHQKTVDIEQSQRFLHYRELVQNWGLLQRCEEDEEGFKFYLVDRTNIARFFRNYQDLMNQYRDWKVQTFREQFSQLQALLSPHWSIEHCPVPKQPYRLNVSCEIAEKSTSFVAPHPLTLERWWYEKGQVLTQQLTQIVCTPNNAETTTASEELNGSLHLEKPTCRTCEWHDPSHEGNQFGVWCSYYRESFGDDRIQAMPQHCRKWRNAAMPRLEPVLREAEFVRCEIVPLAQIGNTIEVKATSLDLEPVDAKVNHAIQHLDLQTVLQYLEQLSDAELKKVEKVIQRRLRAKV
ncbi:hypothetical protein H6F51_04755 [Cyanobacteria bacterium FACHB-DQ100]|nr:hypothetical protein [Cyanobacteria bacterium FACHB-DQ100]